MGQAVSATVWATEDGMSDLAVWLVFLLAVSAVLAVMPEPKKKKTRRVRLVLQPQPTRRHVA